MDIEGDLMEAKTLFFADDVTEDNDGNDTSFLCIFFFPEKWILTLKLINRELVGQI